MTEATTEPEGSSPADRPESDSARSVVAIAVTVTRTGGFAGLRRTWHAQPDTDDAPRWIALIDTCPWAAAAPTRAIPPMGADRFVWRVDARCGDAEREAALADPEVQGPWRELIDAVRAATGKATGNAPETDPRRDGPR